MFYDADLQHPAVFGKHLAEEYRELLDVQCHLLSKKLVVCDLDNTLWDGLIGEGPVAHHAERQQALLRLRQKGVVLAIASKNEAKNVTWAGGVLSEGDFVCSQVNWDPKTINIQRIRNP